MASENAFFIAPNPNLLGRDFPLHMAKTTAQQHNGDLLQCCPKAVFSAVGVCAIFPGL